MYFHHPLCAPSVTPLVPPIYPLLNFMSSFFHNLISHWVKLVMPTCALVWTYPPDHGRPTNVHTPKEKWKPLTKQLLTGDSCSARDGASRATQAWMISGRSCEIITASLTSWVQNSCHVERKAFHSTPSYPLALPFFLSLLAHCYLRTGRLW